MTGQPLAGAAVSVAGAPRGAFSGDNGTFAVPAQAGQVTLEVSYLGYRTETVTVPSGTNNMDVALQVDVLNLEEIVVTGQATGVSRRNLANAVSTVSARELDRVPAASVEQTLRGKVAGANIQANSGAPGGGMQIQLRGVSTILGNHTPLYVVDGVIVSDETIPSGVHTITVSSSNPVRGGGQDNSANRIADLNPYDIESIEVLKGSLRRGHLRVEGEQWRRDHQDQARSGGRSAVQRHAALRHVPALQQAGSPPIHLPGGGCGVLR